MKYLVLQNTAMAHIVFISYSNKDKNVADTVCSTLEGNGIRCWIAPRDITPGAPFAEAIIDGIKGSKIFVLIFSSNSNQSNQVIKEVDRAVHHGLAIIPLRLEDVSMSKQLEYYVSDVHWLDAITPPIELHINKLCKVIKDLLTIDKIDRDNIKEAFKAEGVIYPEKTKAYNWLKLSRIIVPAVLIVIFLAILGSIWFPKRQANIKSINDLKLSEKNTSNSEKTIVVLPFKNLTGEKSLDYIVQGQNDALTTELSMISQIKPQLRVISGITATKIANTPGSIPEIALENKIDFLLEGSVLNAGDSVILDLRIIKTYPEENTIWADKYKSDISNILKLYNNVAQKIVSKMGFELTSENLAKLPSPGKVNLNAYKAYLRGMHYLNYSAQDSIKKGFEFLKSAIDLDPADPYAYTYLALGYLDIAHSPLDPGDALPKAEAAAFRSLSLDTTIAETYSAIAQLYMYYMFKFRDAEKYFKKALAMNPNSAITHYHYAWALYLFGRMDEAIAEHKLAQKYDPFNPQHTAWLGSLCYTSGRYEEAVAEALKSFEIQKDYHIGYFVLGMAYRKMGRTDEAINAHKKLAEIMPEWEWALGYTYAATGHREEAEKILKKIESRPPDPWNAYGRAVMYSILGKNDDAFKWIAYEPHHGGIPWVAVEPWFYELHNDPRFNEFVKNLNLPSK